MHTKVPVLDHGYVTLIESMGTEETIIEAARMSTDRGFVSWDPYTRCNDCQAAYAAGELLTANDPTWCKHENTTKMPRGDLGLLEYLYMNGHTTPLEMCELHVEVCAPIMVWRQWHRHRTQSYNEQSGRYGPLPDLFYTPTSDRISQSFSANANKQASGSGASTSRDGDSEIARQMSIHQSNARVTYELLLEAGMAPELARINVPVSQYSKCRVKTDLHNWLGFLKLRLDQHAQYEIREYAKAVASIVKALWPRVYGLFVEETLNAVKFNETEIRWLRRFAATFREKISANATIELSDLERKRLLRKLMIEER